MNYQVTWFHKETNEMQSQSFTNPDEAFAVFKAVIRDGHKGVFMDTI